MAEDLPEFSGRVLPGYNFAYTNEMTLDDQVGDETDIPGFNDYHGWGRLNAHQTLQLAMTRIDAKRTVTGLELSWVAPQNALLKRPYQIEWKYVVTDARLPLTNSNAFHYEPGRVRHENH